MSDRSRRVVIAVLALAAVAVFLLATWLWVIGGLGCEDADEALDTVRCDGERGGSWRLVQDALVLISAVALVGGIVVGLARASFAAFAIPALLALPVFYVVFAIGEKEVADRPVPRLTDVRVPDRTCTVPCAAGLRVAFRVDRDARVDLHLEPARYEDIGGRQYSSGVIARGGRLEEGGADFDAGAHRVRVGGEIVNPADQRGPLPAGGYVLEVNARPQNAGNQSRQSLGPVRRRITIERERDRG